MEKLIGSITTSHHIDNYESLGRFVEGVWLSEDEYLGYVNEPVAGEEYGRNVLAERPFECVLINWPPSSESAVHFHDGFFGYALVLEGKLEDVSYDWKGNMLIERYIDLCPAGSVIAEPEGTVHKFRNNSVSHRAISLHFYSPPIESFDGMKLFNLSTRQIGILSGAAQSANWSDLPGHFKEIQDKAFEFIPFDESK